MPSRAVAASIQTCPRVTLLPVSVISERAGVWPSCTAEDGADLVGAAPATRRRRPRSVWPIGPVSVLATLCREGGHSHDTRHEPEA